MLEFPHLPRLRGSRAEDVHNVFEIQPLSMLNTIFNNFFSLGLS